MLEQINKTSPAINGSIIYHFMLNIKQLVDRLNGWIKSEKGKDVLIVLIIILTALGSFELGRLSKQDNASGVKILPTDTDIQERNQDADQSNTDRGNDGGNAFTASATQALPSLSKGILDIPKNNLEAVKMKGNNFFASTRGTKYYPIGCSAGKSIKIENRIYFNSAKEAQEKGYQPSSSCDQ